MKTEFEDLILNLAYADRVVFVTKPKDPAIYLEFIQSFIAESAARIAFLTTTFEPDNVVQLKVEDTIISFDPSTQELNYWAKSTGSALVVLTEKDFEISTWKTEKIFDSDCVDFVFKLADQEDMDELLEAVAICLEDKSDLNFRELKPCLFLDRDGVIVHDVPYNSDPKKVQLCNGIENAIESAHKLGWWVAMVSNQAGLGREKLKWNQLGDVQMQVARDLAQKKVWIDRWEVSPYIAGSAIQEGSLLPQLRKPRTGMYNRIRFDLGVDMSKSAMIGDRASDLFGAFRAGIKNLYLTRTAEMDEEIKKLKNFQKSNPDFNWIELMSLDRIQLNVEMNNLEKDL